MSEQTHNITSNRDDSAPLDGRLYALFSAAIEDGIGIVKKMAEEAVYITVIGNGPKLTWRKTAFLLCPNNMMRLRTMGSLSDPPGKYNNQVIPLPFAAGRPFQELLAYAQSQPRINSHLGTPDSDLVVNFLETLVGDVLDRYIHLHPGFTLQPDKLLRIYLPVEKYLLEENLDHCAHGADPFPQFRSRSI